MLVRLPCLEPIMTTTTRPPRPPVPPSADPAVPLSLPDAEALGERIQAQARSEEHTSELQSRGHLVCRLLLEKKKGTTLADGVEADHPEQRDRTSHNPSSCV